MSNSMIDRSLETLEDIAKSVKELRAGFEFFAPPSITTFDTAAPPSKSSQYLKDTESQIRRIHQSILEVQGEYYPHHLNRP